MKGSLIWKIQRYSSLITLSYVIYLSYFFISSSDITFFSWTTFILSYQMRGLTTLVALILLVHAAIGLWTVGTDYLTTRTLGFLNNTLSNNATNIRYSYFFTIALLLIFYLLGTLYIVWKYIIMLYNY